MSIPYSKEFELQCEIILSDEKTGTRKELRKWEVEEKLNEEQSVHVRNQ